MPERPDHVELFRDKAGEWRWRLVDGSNGKTVVVSQFETGGS